MVRKCSPPSSLRNTVPTRGNWAGLRLVESHGRDALGARVRVTAGGRTQTHPAGCGRINRKQHSGLHSLRHTLATQLLRAQTPFHVISDILGHSSSTSTMIYAKADVESLRTAALGTEEVCKND